MPQANDFDGGVDRPSGSLRGEPHSVRCEPSTREDARQLENFVRLLMEGDRVGCRDFVRERMHAGEGAKEILERCVWPACAIIDGWSRRDRISAVHEQCATMLLRKLVQGLEPALPRRSSRCRTILVASGAKPLEELAAEIFAGLAEADGFDVVFVGGGVESDDLFSEVSRRRPDFLVSYAAAGQDAARLRRLLGSLRSQVPVPGLKVGVGGGVFSRAPGLGEELGVDFEGDTPFDLVEALGREFVKTPETTRRSKAA